MSVACAYVCLCLQFSSTCPIESTCGLDPAVVLYYHFRTLGQDTWAYVLHHAITVALVMLSAHAGFHRIGGVISFFFDLADPPMLIGKALLYLSVQPDDVYQQIADGCMAIFVVLFVVTRNLFLYLARSASVVEICQSHLAGNNPQIAPLALVGSHDVLGLAHCQGHLQSTLLQPRSCGR